MVKNWEIHLANGAQVIRLPLFLLDILVCIYSICVFMLLIFKIFW